MTTRPHTAPMDDRNKTISFRVSEEKFERLTEVAEREDEALSRLMRECVEDLIERGEGED